jgi:hypothetical protein
MTETSTAPQPVVPTEQTIVVNELPELTTETCDRCGPAVRAAAEIVLPGGGLLTLCGHHSQQFGYVHPVPANRLTGSDH